jgi:molybdopterin/thiamine biosynthesis adenylyltransferase
VKLIGLGGVGQIVARYGALFLTSTGSEVRLVLIDGDSFEPSNANRMFFGAFGNKAAVTREELLSRFTDTSLAVIAVEEYLTPDNMGRLIREGDIVLLCVDNHATRKLVNGRCAELRDVCLLSGGNDGVGLDNSGTFRRGTYGNVQAYVRRCGQDASPPLTHLHPEIANPSDRLPSEQSCTELVASVPQILFANLAVASALLNTLWLHLNGALAYSELCFDIAEGRMRPSMLL